MTEENDNGKTKENSFETFEEYLGSVDDKTRELYEKHTAGLKSALEKEREERKSLSDRIKEIAPKAEKGSELESRLAETLKMLEDAEKRNLETDRRAKFIEQAIRPEIGCSNVNAAYKIALADNLFDKNGDPIWPELKKNAPELFRSKVTDAGKNSKVDSNDMNSIIRSVAGYQEKKDDYPN